MSNRVCQKTGGNADCWNVVILNVLVKDLAICSGGQILREYAQNDSSRERHAKNMRCTPRMLNSSATRA